MGVFTNIQRALDSRLNALTDRPYVAWPNTKFTPDIGNAYLRPTLLPADSSLYTINDVNMHPGVYQVDIYTPLEKGLISALTLADAIKTHFEAQRVLVQGDDRVFIQNISLRMTEREEAWYRAYLEINYICYS